MFYINYLILGWKTEETLKKLKPIHEKTQQNPKNSTKSKKTQANWPKTQANWPKTQESANSSWSGLRKNVQKKAWIYHKQKGLW